MRNVSGTTEADGIKYPLTWQEFESFEEYLEVKGGEEAILLEGNAAQKQGATQGMKGNVREAVRDARTAGHSDEVIQAAIDEGDADGDEALEAVLASVSKHQENAAEYVKGTSRRTDGLTKTASRRAGEALAEKLGEDGYRALLVQQGFDEAEIEEILG